MKTKLTSMPVFKSESDEADWWASGEGRRFVKQKSAAPASKKKIRRLAAGSAME